MIDYKMDYTIQDPQERVNLVQKIVENTPPDKLTPHYLEMLSDYIIFAMDKQERQQKKILTDNHMSWVNKRETSYQGLVTKFENGEDGIFNLIANDKNIIFQPKDEITAEDVAAIPPLKDLVDAIGNIAEQAKAASGKKRFSLYKQLIEMRKDQYVIRSIFKKPIYFQNVIKSFAKINLSEKITFDEDNLPVSEGFVSFFNPSHISAILCNYSRLKKGGWGNFFGDAYFMMEDFDKLVESALKEYPAYEAIVLYKIDGKTNLEIKDILQQKFNICHSVEYISSLWRNKIPKIIAAAAVEQYVMWYYTNKEKGIWKKCSRCGQIKLAHNLFFSKNKTSKDGYYSICKKCRNKKKYKE